MTNLPALRPAAGELSTDRHDPRDDWPEEARALRSDLLEVYGPNDALPDMAGAWIARQRSQHTRRAYARGFRVYVAYAHRSGTHPLEATSNLADAFSNYLTTAPTMRRVKGGKHGEMAPTGPARSDAARVQVLSSCASFYLHAVRMKARPSSPFEGVTRPKMDGTYSSTVGLESEETERLIAAARDRSPRAYALVTLLYLLGPRVGEVLALNADQLTYDKGHRVLPLIQKGNSRQNVPLPPLALDALLSYLDGRTTGPLFVTRTGGRLSEPAVWKLMRSLAKQAGLPQWDKVKPHTMRHAFITDSAKANVPLHLIQRSVNHKDPRTTTRYIEQGGLLDDHPTHELSKALAKKLRKRDGEAG